MRLLHCLFNLYPQYASSKVFFKYASSRLRLQFTVFSVYILYAFCLYSVYFLSMFCILSVYILYTFCLYSVYFLSIFCTLSVYIVYTLCLYSVYFYGLYGSVTCCHKITCLSNISPAYNNLSYNISTYNNNSRM